tara:strand:+ start:126 stop:650 length:525 start_codon:yes stop_codon:yes gene_type:complete
MEFIESLLGKGRALFNEGLGYFDIAKRNEDLTDVERSTLNNIYEDPTRIEEVALLEAEGWSREKNDAGNWEYTRTLTEEEKRDRDANLLGQFSTAEVGSDKPAARGKLPTLISPPSERTRVFRDTQVSSQVPTYLQSRLQDSATYDRAAKSGIQGLLASEPVSSAIANLLTRRV